MMIVEAVNSAPTQHAVYFLVTAYLESLRHFERTCGVPQRVIELPVAGPADLSERLDVLRCTRDALYEANVVVSEVSSVLTSALARLGSLAALGETQPAQVAQPPIPARSDTRHSSLSV